MVCLAWLFVTSVKPKLKPAPFTLCFSLVDIVVDVFSNLPPIVAIKRSIHSLKKRIWHQLVIALLAFYRPTSGHAMLKTPVPILNTEVKQHWARSGKIGDSRCC